MDLASVLPRWTKRVFTKTGGRDPLGLSRVSGSITDFMMPGITTITPRARYFSFFCWALEDIPSKGETETYEDFKAALRRREAIVALSTSLAGHEGLMHGAEEAAAELASPSYPDEYSIDFQVLPSNPLGGYGQYYSGSLYRLGLTERDEKGIDYLSNEAARTLAHQYEESIKATSVFQSQRFSEKSIDKTELEESARLLSIDAVSTPQAAGEQQALVDLFLAMGGPRNEDDLNRRHSLALILHIARAYQELGIQPGFRELDTSLLYAPQYYGVLASDGAEVGAWAPPEGLKRASGYWRQFCLQEYVTIALERLLSAVLEIAGAQSAGVTETELLRTILQDDFEGYLENRLAVAARTPREMMAGLGMSGPPSRDQVGDFRVGYAFHHPCSEEQLYSNSDWTSPQMEAAQAMLMLAVVYGKWRGVDNDNPFYEVMTKAGSELCATNVLPYLEAWFDPALTWEEALGELVARLVLDQHDRIMYEKRRLDSAWFSRSGGRLLKDQDYEPHRRNSRFQNAVRILCDLGLLEMTGPEDALGITTAGSLHLDKILEG